LILLSLLLSQEDIAAQKVIDNEVLSSGNDDESNSNAESGSNLNEFAAKPLVHVSIEGTEINDNIRGGDGNDLMSGEDGQDTLQGNDGDDEIDGGKGEDNIDGGEGDDSLNGGDDDDNIKGGIGDDEIDGGDGRDIVDGGEGKDKLKGGNDADRFVCDQDDKISDYNSLENDVIIGECEYEDKGLIPTPSLEQSPIPATSDLPDSQDKNNNNFRSFDSKDSDVPDSKDNLFKKFLSKFINNDVSPIFDN
jgi:Ca2+-binding RTX toxin-like protein